MTEEVTLLAVGDVDDRAPGTHFDLVRSILQSGDITFGQLEFVLAGRERLTRVGEAVGSQGGLKDPRVGARVLADAGFTVMSAASNHVMDQGQQVLSDTIAAAEEHGIHLVGAGSTLKEARQPVIVECKGVRVGFLAYLSVGNDDVWATDDHAGAVPLRASTTYETVESIGGQAGAAPRVVTQTFPEDLAAMVEDVAALRSQVDILVVSAHWGIYQDPATVAMHRVEAAHAAIDAGADLILGHHPHIIQGIEFYKGKAIFYALNNFCLPVRGPDGRFISPDQHNDSQLTYIARITIRDNAVTRVAAIPCYLANAASGIDNLGYTTEPLPRADARSEEVRQYMQWTCDCNKPDIRPRPFEPLLTTCAFDGDEILITPTS